MSFNLATILTETALAAPDGPVYRFAGTVWGIVFPYWQRGRDGSPL